MSVNTNGSHPWADKRLNIPSPKEGDWYEVLDVPTTYNDKEGYPQWRISDDGIPDTDVSIRRWRYSGELGQFICDFGTPPIDVSAWAAETLLAK